MERRHLFRFMLAVSLAVALLAGALGVRPAQSAVPHLAYGFNLHADWQGMLDMGFDWLKGFPKTDLAGYPPQVNILFRFSAKASDLSNVAAFVQEVHNTAVDNKDYIDAYEIGNEVNIDNSDYGWGATPNAADYKTLLCAAYHEIRQIDPTAIVVSA